MDIITAEPRRSQSDAAHDDHARPSRAGSARSAGVETVNIETVTSNPVLPTDRKWAIRFDAGGTVTIVLGMRNYGSGWFSAYFAGLVAARLGIPFGRVRVYYSANLPAVLQTPVPSPVLLRCCDVGPVARAAADIIDAMCDQVIEKGGFAFSTMANVGVHDVGFDKATGRFFVLDRERSGNILELAKATPGGSSLSTEFARNVRRDDRHSNSKEIQVSSAA
jgi:carbon-monoxide dehydrogenase large subunit